MRSLALVLPASLIFVIGVQGQALTEHAAAAAGAAIGTGAGKGLSNSMTKIFGETDKETAKAAKPDAKKPTKSVTDPAPDPLTAKSKPSPVPTPGGDFGPAPLSAPTRRAARKPVLREETAAALPAAATMTPIATAPPIVEPIIKVPTAEDLANIKVGTTAEDMVSALGQPSSRLVIPDDDGHLRETCQYWANGQVLGTIRLDNGQVASVEARVQ